MSPEVSSTTNSCQVPFGLIPVKAPDSVVCVEGAAVPPDRAVLGPYLPEVVVGAAVPDFVPDDALVVALHLVGVVLAVAPLTRLPGVPKGVRYEHRPV